MFGVIINIMNVGLSTLYDIGSSYTIKLNDEEILIFEEDERNVQKSPEKKRLKEEEEKKVAEAKKETLTDKLSPDEERLVNDLQSRDSEVKTHEAAHQSAGGGMTGAASYTYQQGPDGKMYAIGGEVSINMPSGSSPQETIANARQVAASAMAAGSPSPQDHAVAASARVMEMKAQQQLAKEQHKQVLGKDVYAKEVKNASSSGEKNKDFLDEINIST
ncbi:MAG: putative metalloprotease CJM1_0395 family protein [Sulfurimonas sp.]|nr:putative metalloprotease CJM1_0395 family protein [Sulfurimonas sp.]